MSEKIRLESPSSQKSKKVIKTLLVQFTVLEGLELATILQDNNIRGVGGDRRRSEI